MSEHNPAYRDLIADAMRLNPKKVEGLWNVTATQYVPFLLRKVFPIMEIENMPEEWPEDYVKERIFINGYFCITDTPVGVVPLECGFAGRNLWHEPTECVIANPVLGSFRRTIGEDCAFVRLQFNYTGIMDVVNKYAEMLASCDASIGINMLNARVPLIGEAGTKAQAEAIKKMYTDISKGQPCVVWRKSASPGMETKIYYNNVKNTYIADMILRDKRTILNEFLTIFGINNANSDKRERLITDEANSNNIELEVNVAHWKSMVQSGLDVANRLYGLNLQCRMPYVERAESDTQEGGDKSGNNAS